jgi:hypothetical protein
MLYTKLTEIQKELLVISLIDASNKGSSIHGSDDRNLSVPDANIVSSKEDVSEVVAHDEQQVETDFYIDYSRLSHDLSPPLTPQTNNKSVSIDMESMDPHIVKVDEISQINDFSEFYKRKWSD